MIKKIIKPLNFIILAILLVFVILLIIGTVNVTSPAMVSDSSFMISDNIAKGKRVTGDVVSSKKLVDGKVGSVTSLKKQNNAVIVVDLGEICAFNSIILREDGFHCNSFLIEISNDNNK